MASCWAGFAAAPGVFARGGQERADNVLAYYAHMRDDDLYQSHTIVNPQIDRSKPAAEQEEPFLYVGVVSERDDGIVVRGAKMVGTAALFGDEIFVGTIEPLGRDDQDYALTFSIPFNTPRREGDLARLLRGRPRAARGTTRCPRASTRTTR